MAKFRSTKSLQKFVSVHASLHNHFNKDRHLESRENFKPTDRPRWLSGGSLQPEAF